MILNLSWLAALSGETPMTAAPAVVEFRLEPAERDGLGRAAGGVVLGVEIEDDGLAQEVREPRLAAAVGWQREVRGGIALFEFFCHVALDLSHCQFNANGASVAPLEVDPRAGAFQACVGAALGTAGKTRSNPRQRRWWPAPPAGEDRRRLVSWLGVGHRARAKAAMQRMVDAAEGARLPARNRGAGRARRIRHVCIHVAEAMGLVALAAIALLAFRLSSGPIYLAWLHDRVASGLQERVGGGYVGRARSDLCDARIPGASDWASAI